MKNKKHLVVIQGPTASGKTALSIALAKKWQTVIFSADSRQFYKEMEIGTAKPSVSEQENIPHFFIDSHSIHEALTSASFEKEALQLLENEFKKQDVIILVGGSGMFIDALCYGLDNLPHDEEIRQKWNKLFEEKGLEYLQNELKEKDEIAFQTIDIQNPVRIIRALEVMDCSQSTYSELLSNVKKARPFEIHKFVIDLPREVLYNRINFRVDWMMQNHLLDEVKSLIAYKDLQVMKTVGYSELIDFFEGKSSLETAVELIKRNTRRYAKRQLTWFRRDENNTWLKSHSIENQIAEIEEILGTILEK
jgi:tRNA dimethylallyltransferase